MYPYRTRMQWFLAGRYAHLVQAANRRSRIVQDSTLEVRVANLKFWNLVRFIVSIPLGLTLMATVASTIARIVPGGLAEELVSRLLAYSSLFAGLFTLAYLFLTRLLSQIEIDILAILTLDTN